MRTRVIKPKVNLDSKAYIYGLTEPDTGLIRYVGQTVNLKSRMRNHATCNERHDRPTYLNSLRNRWLNDLMDKGGPGFVILEECSLRDACERECFWYDKLKSEGVDLLNGGRPTRTYIVAVLYKREKQKEGTYIYKPWEHLEHEQLHMLNPPGCGCKDWPTQKHSN